MKCHRIFVYAVCVASLLMTGCTPSHKPSTLRTSDTHMAKLAQQAQSLFEMQRPAQAAPLYLAALNRARALNDDPAIARLAYNLGACRLQSGDASGAAGAFQEAIQAAQSAEMSPAEAQLLLGHAWLQQNQTDQVLTLCDETIVSLKAAHDLTMILRFELLKADTFVNRKDMDSAKALLQTVQKRITSQTPPAICAASDKIQGVIFMHRQQYSQAGKTFTQEARCWTTANRPLEVINALIRAADAFQQAEHPSLEVDCRYRAARALLGQGRHTEAQGQLNRLKAIPPSEWPDSLHSLVSLLQQEIAHPTST